MKMKLSGCALFPVVTLLVGYFVTTPVQLTAQTGCLDARNYYQTPGNTTPETEDFGLVLDKAIVAATASTNAGSVGSAWALAHLRRN